jgi:DNA-binding response OmpR family regulator
MIVGWLRDSGGALPRQWLDLGRRLLDMYQGQGAARPLAASDWRRVARERPHILRVDLKAERVFVDNQEIRDISPGSFKLLRYLYIHRDRICTRSELYYYVVRDFSQEPRSPDDSGYEDPKEYAGLLDSQIWRLRKEIEPDSSRPIFVNVVRRRGVRLEQAG